MSPVLPRHAAGCIRVGSMRCRSVHRLAYLPLIVLISVAAFESAEASFRILWRYAVLSWDNPATQAIDELACESSPPSRAGAEAGQSTRLAVRSSGRLDGDRAAPRPDRPALSSGITRSPPAA